MSIIKLVPSKDSGKVENAIGKLQRTIEDIRTNADTFDGLIIIYRVDPDGKGMTTSYTVECLSALEAIGLMHLVQNVLIE